MKFKEMDSLMRYLFSYYPNYLAHVNGIKENEVVYGNSIVKLVHKAFYKLNEQEQFFLRNEYLGNDKSWWYGYYSRSSYYRIKTIYMKKFIDIINYL